MINNYQPESKTYEELEVGTLYIVQGKDRIHFLSVLEKFTKTCRVEVRYLMELSFRYELHALNGRVYIYEAVKPKIRIIETPKNPRVLGRFKKLINKFWDFCGMTGECIISIFNPQFK